MPVFRSRAESVGSRERLDYLPFVLEEAPYDGFTSRFLPDRNRPAFPWQSAVDRLPATAGFVPGNHVLLSVDYRSRQLTISLDHNYRIAGREMTEQEIQDAFTTMNNTQRNDGIAVALVPSVHEHRARQLPGSVFS